MKKALLDLYDRDIEKLKAELLLYKNESDIWIIDRDISNSAGNLSLHLIGNLNYFIGTVLGKTGYVRTRADEFTLKNIPLATLTQQLDQTKAMVHATLSALQDSDFAGNYPKEKNGQILSMHRMLLHLLAHLNYHLGQVNYHRRLLDK